MAAGTPVEISGASALAGSASAVDLKPFLFGELPEAVQVRVTEWLSIRDLDALAVTSKSCYGLACRVGHIAAQAWETPFRLPAGTEENGLKRLHRVCSDIGFVFPNMGVFPISLFIKEALLEGCLITFWRALMFPLMVVIPAGVYIPADGPSGGASRETWIASIRDWLNDDANLVYLDQVKHLDISKEAIYRECRMTYLPYEVTRLRNLEILCCCGCALFVIPGFLRQIPTLYNLTFTSNNLRRIPKSVCELPQLIYLFLSMNKFKRIPRAIKRASGLERLYLCHNKIGRIPAWLDTMLRLEQIWLTGNPIPHETIVTLRAQSEKWFLPEPTVVVEETDAAS